jgi:hypothetical protein
MSAQVQSSHSGPLLLADSADLSGLEMTGEDNLVDGWWTASVLTVQKTR